MTATFPVLSNDYGIRPAGPPDACFYCQQPVGSAHGAECVVIVRTVIYGVYLTGLPSRRIGTFTKTEPASWDLDLCEFTKNEGSWCADNAARNDESQKYEGEPLPETTGSGCLCSLLRFRVDQILGDVRRATS